MTQNPLLGASTRILKIGTHTLEVFIFKGDSDKIDAQIKRVTRQALLRGEHVEENGVRQWREVNAILNPGEVGSDIYTWHKDGERVLAEEILVTRAKDGVISKRVLKRIWSRSA